MATIEQFSPLTGIQASNSPNAELRTIRGVSFIRVRGNTTERARGHGSLLRDRVRNGAITALSKKNEWVIRRSPGATQWKPLQETVVWAYKNILLPHLARRNSVEGREVVRAMSEATGLPERMFLQSLFQADVMMLLCRLSVMKHTLGPNFVAAALPEGACSPAATRIIR